MWEALSLYVFGAKPDGDMPARVAERIAQQQITSERLIGWVQLGLVLIFGTLYLLSPTTAADAAFKPVPWALSLYFIFTLMRLVCAHFHYMPGWLLVISIVMDIALLMVLIWSFHIKYDQPATFYLKAPTMIYVFIFIALRALRFEPRYIVISGVVAVAGWAILVAYAAMSTPDDTMITRDYVTYLTSNAILIGAEVDKMISIVIVTAVLAISVLRAQRTFRQAVIDNSAKEDLSRFVSREVADRITSADQAIQPGEGESKVASVLFTDIEGFSTVSEKLSPSELAQMLNEYFLAVGAVIERHGGVIIHFEGDLILVTFNAVTPDADHAANAVRTALGIRDICEDQTFGCQDDSLRTRCGINTGEIIVGAVGAAGRLTFTVHGDEVNIAARLEQLNKEHGTYILCGENTVTACGTAFTFSPVTEVAVRGREAKTKVFTPDT